MSMTKDPSNRIEFVKTALSASVKIIVASILALYSPL